MMDMESTGNVKWLASTSVGKGGSGEHTERVELGSGGTAREEMGLQKECNTESDGESSGASMNCSSDDDNDANHTISAAPEPDASLSTHKHYVSAIEEAQL